MSVNLICEYFQQTTKYYLGCVWPEIQVSIYEDIKFGTIFELKLYNKNHAIIGKEIIDLEDITMEEFDYILRKFYANFYYQARTSIILKLMQDNNLKVLDTEC